MSHEVLVELVYKFCCNEFDYWAGFRLSRKRICTFFIKKQIYIKKGIKQWMIASECYFLVEPKLTGKTIIFCCVLAFRQTIFGF